MPWKSRAGRSAVHPHFGEGLLLSEAFPLLLGMRWETPARYFSSLYVFLLNTKALSLRPEMARGNIPVGICVLLLFPLGRSWSPFLGALTGGRRQHGSSHALRLLACCKSSVGSAAGR